MAKAKSKAPKPKKKAAKAKSKSRKRRAKAAVDAFDDMRWEIIEQMMGMVQEAFASLVKKIAMVPMRLGVSFDDNSIEKFYYAWRSYLYEDATAFDHSGHEEIARIMAGFSKVGGITRYGLDTDETYMKKRKGEVQIKIWLTTPDWSEWLESTFDVEIEEPIAVIWNNSGMWPTPVVVIDGPMATYEEFLRGLQAAFTRRWMHKGLLAEVWEETSS